MVVGTIDFERKMVERDVRVGGLEEEKTERRTARAGREGRRIYTREIY